ncbi:MAG: hypothetical protein H5T82_02910 [Demequina sp.]|uniref:hypothetical protein n=1 Tax=Demequina sp. TaxID=2050685 RepID=UPI001999B43E|nr:hypothetical protein [Demequina sp.]MBC7297824.1 hypothetical protein [Demequina sp.]
MSDSDSKAGAPLYRFMAPELPDIGWSGPLPRQLSADAVRAIHACDNVPALGAMLGQLRSYWASAGGIAIAIFGGLATGAVGWDVASTVLFALGVPAGLATVEARRRALQWQGVIEARLATIGSRR